MAVEEKQLYLRGGARAEIEPCLNMLEDTLTTKLIVQLSMMVYSVRFGFGFGF